MDYYRILVAVCSPEYIKFLAKKIAEMKERENLNTAAILSTEPVLKAHEAKIQILAQHLERMEAELKVLHDQLVDLVAKQR
ncbi:hypothetical protein BTM294_14250 [Helicobacter pylori]